MQPSYCVKENKPCVGWVLKYFSDCLCNSKDDISFFFGFISLICWGVAEIPQIFTNFRAKSSHGVSILFLLTWVAGFVYFFFFSFFFLVSHRLFLSKIILFYFIVPFFILFLFYKNVFGLCLGEQI